MSIFLNIFECDGNLLNRLDVTYEVVCVATQKEEYYTDLLETIIEHKDRSKTPLSKEKLWQAINTIVEEMEDEECDSKHNNNYVITYTLIQPPVTTNTPREKTAVAN